MFAMENVKEYLEHYGSIMLAYGKAWEERDIERILPFYADTFRYADPACSTIITSRPEMREYLVRAFRKYPKQEWTKRAWIYPGTKAGCFALYYEFRISGPDSEFKGSGMERYEFVGDKISVNIAHFRVEHPDFVKLLGV